MSRPFLYMPVQRWKPAERNALASLTSDLRPLVAPLIEIGVSGVSKTATPTSLTNHLSAAAEQIAESCDGYEMFLDLVHLEALRPGLNCRDNQHPLAFIIDRINAERFLFDDMRPTVVPVTGLNRSRRYQSAVGKIAKDSRICIRLTRSDLKSTRVNAKLSKLLDSLRLEADHTDIVVDLGLVAVSEMQALTQLIERTLPRPDIWNSLTILAGSFPKELSSFTSIGRHDVKRAEWDLYIHRILKNRSLREFAAFGDYTIQHAVYSEPPEFCRPSSSIRYAAKDKWIVMRGEVPREGGRGENSGRPMQWFL